MRAIERRMLLPLAQVLTLYLIGGLLLGLACLGLFALLADAVLAEGSITQMDRALAAALHAEATPLTTARYLAVSWFGGEGIYVVGLGVGLVLAGQRRWGWLVFWIVALAGGGLLNTALKAWFARPRPVFTDPFVLETYYSFPSAHAMTSLITYGLLAALVCLRVRRRWARSLIVFAAVLLVVLIGISRLALGVHYLSDVLAGYAAGGLWLSICVTGLLLWHRRTADG